MPTMMDVKNRFSYNQTICDAGSEWSDDFLDLGAEYVPSPAHDKILRIVVTELFTDLAEGVRVILKDSAAITTPPSTGPIYGATIKEHTSSPILLPAQLNASYINGVPIDIPLSNLTMQRYAQVRYDQITSVATAGKVIVGLV